MNYTDTIVAISTPAGAGAIAVIRCSGRAVAHIISRVFYSAQTKNPIKKLTPNVTSYGYIMDGEEMVDEVITTYYRAPHSYTGEDIAEISCHGSVYIQERIIRLMLRQGCRLAERGEFTLRAFMNGKMDLARAEGVADLIASTNKYQHHLSLKQMRGGVSNKLKELRQRLVAFASLLELELDFSQEDVTFADRKALSALLEDLHEEIKRMASTFSTGNALKRGIPVAIIGKPNSGKSTLLNALLEEDRALVSEIPGTTRDTIEDTILIQDIPFRFIDTAGLREERGIIEAMGIEKSFEKMAQASIILYVFDASTTKPEDAREELTAAFRQVQALHPDADLQEKKIILAGNKIDLLDPSFPPNTGRSEKDVVFISAKRHENMAALTHALLESSDIQILCDELVITGLRHYDALRHSGDAIGDALHALKQNIPSDLVSIDIRKALYHLGLITGEVSTEELLTTIFSRFCIGK